MQEFTPVEYIKIDIANQFGKDKESFKKRIQWVNSVKDLRSKTDLAENPAQYYAAVLALEDAMNQVPTGHLVGLDACASGIAILGILTGCPVTSKNTGVIGKKRMDMYEQCTIAMNQLLDNDVIVARSETKGAQMPHFYGSKAAPRKVFGEDTEELMAFYQAQETVAPGACYIMRELLASWQPYALEHSHTLPDGFNAIVPVLQKMKAKIEVDELAHASLAYIYEDNVGSEQGLAVAANATHGVDGFIVRETVRRCNYNPTQLRLVHEVLYNSLMDNQRKPKKRGDLHPIEQMAVNHRFISLRGADFITEENVLEFSVRYREELMNLICDVLAKPSFEMLTIHDEFKCHPNHVNQMRYVYRQVLAELADSRVGEQIIQELRGDNTYVLNKITNDLGDHINQSEYTLS